MHVLNHYCPRFLGCPRDHVTSACERTKQIHFDNSSTRAYLRSEGSPEHFPSPAASALDQSCGMEHSCSSLSLPRYLLSLSRNLAIENEPMSHLGHRDETDEHLSLLASSSVIWKKRLLKVMPGFAWPCNGQGPSRELRVHFCHFLGITSTFGLFPY